MSTSYNFHDLTGEYKFSREERSVNQAEVFCKVMGLPKIPFLRGFYNESYWRIPGGTKSVTQPKNPEKMHSKIQTSYHCLKQSAHWKHWGIKKLNAITIDDVQGRFYERFRHCYETEEALQEIKEDILLFLDAYSSATYYRMSI